MSSSFNTTCQISRRSLSSALRVFMGWKHAVIAIGASLLFSTPLIAKEDSQRLQEIKSRGLLCEQSFSAVKRVVEIGRADIGKLSKREYDRLIRDARKANNGKEPFVDASLIHFGGNQLTFLRRNGTNKAHAVNWLGLTAWRSALLESILNRNGLQKEIPGLKTETQSLVESSLSTPEIEQSSAELRLKNFKPYAPVETENLLRHQLSEAELQALNKVVNESTDLAREVGLQRLGKEFKEGGAWKRFVQSIDYQDSHLISEILEEYPFIKGIFLNGHVHAFSTERLAHEYLVGKLNHLFLHHLFTRLLEEEHSVQIYQTRRRRDGPLLIVADYLQFQVEFNPDGSLKNIQIRGRPTEELSYALKRKPNPKVEPRPVSQTPLSRPVPIEPRPEPIRQAPWDLQGKDLSEEAAEILISLDHEFPGNRELLMDSVGSVFIEYPEIFHAKYLGRFYKKVRALLRDNEFRSPDQFDELIEEIVSNKLKSLRAENKESHESWVQEHRRFLRNFLYGDLPFEALKPNEVYYLHFDRQPERGRQAFVISPSVHEFLFDRSYNPYGPKRWLRALKRGIVSSRSHSGIKAITWTSELPFNFELKLIRSGRAFRIMMELDDNGVWQLVKIADEHS